MVWMPARRNLGLTLVLATVAGCSGGDSAPPIDTKATIQKASGGDGTAKQSAKAKAGSEEAAKTHPKLH